MFKLGCQNTEEGRELRAWRGRRAKTKAAVVQFAQTHTQRNMHS